MVTPDMSGWLQSTVPDLLKEYNPKDIFNADETRKFSCFMPQKTLAFKNEPCYSGTKFKGRLTVMVACNSDRSQRHKTAFISYR